jgi:CBS domain-containing protein
MARAEKTTATKAPSRLRGTPKLPVFDEVRKSLASSLISISGLLGRPVSFEDREVIGRVSDVVVRWDSGEYPRLFGLLIRIGLRRAFISVSNVADITGAGVVLSSTKLDLRDYVRREGEFLASDDMLDHQLLDIDGARVVRASDLYVTKTGRTWYLVAVDVSFRSFLRRLLPGSAGRTPTPERVVDWSGIQSFGRPGEPARLSKENKGLHKLRPAELADLIEDLGQRERQVLLEILDPEVAADAMEEMESDDLDELLRAAPVDRAADLLARMEPDEAVDALRELPDADRDAVLEAMPKRKKSNLVELLEFDEDEAGGFMTSALVVLKESDTVAAARKKLLDLDNNDIQCIVVVDKKGRLIDDLNIIDLFTAKPGKLVGSVKNDHVPETVQPDAKLDEVIEKLTANRGSSLVVVDEKNKPIGRIMADDVVDAMVKDRGARSWPWQEG